MLNIYNNATRLDLRQFGPLAMWYSVDSLVNRFKDGDTLLTWESMIGGPTFSRIAGQTLYPIYSENTLTNKPSVLNSSNNGVFSTNNDTISIPSSFTFFSVFIYFINSTTYYLLQATSVSGLLCYANTNKTIGIGLTSGGTYWTSPVNAILVGKPYVFVFRLNLSGSGTYHAYLNGELIQSGVPGSTSALTNRPYYTSAISWGVPLKAGALSEIATYNTLLSEPAIQTISYDLMNYYGLS